MKKALNSGRSFLPLSSSTLQPKPYKTKPIIKAPTKAAAVPILKHKKVLETLKSITNGIKTQLKGGHGRGSGKGWIGKGDGGREKGG